MIPVCSDVQKAALLKKRFRGPYTNRYSYVSTTGGSSGSSGIGTGLYAGSTDTRTGAGLSSFFFSGFSFSTFKDRPTRGTDER